MALFSSGVLTHTFAFADNNDDMKKKKTFEEMCAKKKGNEPDALFCRAILGLQQSTNSFFDIFTELRHADTNLQNQINSFFDIFVELDDVADKQCTPGTFASGTNLDGSLICTDIAQNQDCDDGFYMSGIDDDGKIKCKPLPSDSNSICGDSITTAPETCDDGNTINGDGCSSTCTVEITDHCLGVDINDGNECTVDSCEPSTGSITHTDNGSCTATCGDGQIMGAEQCDGTNLGAQSCSTQGFSSGSLSCDNSCVFDTSSCVASPVLQTIDPNPLDFGNALSGGFVPRSVGITLDHAVASDTLVPLFLTGSNPTQFFIAGSCIVPAGNQSCGVEIDFAPTSFGLKTATLNASLEGITITSGLRGNSISNIPL